MYQALAALLHAIHGVHCEEQTGIRETALGEPLEKFQVWVDACDCDDRGVIAVRDAQGNAIGKFEKDFEPIQIRVLRNVLEVVMLDLGQNEFSP